MLNDTIMPTNSSVEVYDIKKDLPVFIDLAGFVPMAGDVLRVDGTPYKVLYRSFTDANRTRTLRVYVREER